MLLDLQLRGNAGMVTARHPEHRPAAHALVADHQIFQRNKHGMPKVQLPGHIRGRHANHKRCAAVVAGRFKIAALLPPNITRFFGCAEVVSFR